MAEFSNFYFLVVYSLIWPLKGNICNTDNRVPSVPSSFIPMIWLVYSSENWNISIMILVYYQWEKIFHFNTRLPLWTSRYCPLWNKWIQFCPCSITFTARSLIQCVFIWYREMGSEIISHVNVPIFCHAGWNLKCASRTGNYQYFLE